MATDKRATDGEVELEAAIEKVVEEHLRRSQTLSQLAQPAEGTSPEFQKVEYEDDIIQEHVYSPHYTLLIAAAVAIAAIFLSLIYDGPLAEMRLECGSDDCDHSFLKDLAWIVALFLAVPFFIWIWRSVIPKLESGSRIDLGKRLFVWWDGPVPRVEHNIELDRIVRVNLVEGEEPDDGDGKSIELVDTTGNKFRVRGICVKSTEDWARALKSEFPHIRM